MELKGKSCWRQGGQVQLFDTLDAYSISVSE
jgi:hypothetical protein